MRHGLLPKVLPMTVEEVTEVVENTGCFMQINGGRCRTTSKLAVTPRGLSVIPSVHLVCFRTLGKLRYLDFVPLLLPQVFYSTWRKGSKLNRTLSLSAFRRQSQTTHFKTQSWSGVQT